MTGVPSNTVRRPSPIYPHVNPSNASPAPSSATLRSPLAPGPGMPNIMPSNGQETLQTQHIPFPPAAMPRTTGYMHSFHPPAVSPGTNLSDYSDFGQPHTSFVGVADVAANAHMPATNIHGQKRAYRQRRKDPSCDTCRERKVKCDATDSSSCTECSSRNVKCQFTKETNRRMSNLRHNQDLQKELLQAKSQVNQLRSMLGPGKGDVPNFHALEELPGPVMSHLPNHNLPHLPGPEAVLSRTEEASPQQEQRQSKKRKIAGTADLSLLGANMEKQGRGIFKPPYPFHRTSSPVQPSPGLPTLPPKEVGDELIRQYHSTIHLTLPFIHWPSFQEQYHAVYVANSLRSTSRIWIALLYAVFACGTLRGSWHVGQNYLETSKSLIDIWTEDLTLDYARAAILHSIFLVETNLKSAGWMWVGIAVRMSFDIGLHCEAGTWSAIEEEMRRRVWWSLYTCDCLLSLELGRPALTKEEDCNVRLPSPVDDQYMRSGIDWLSPTSEQSTSPLLPTIQVVGGIAKLLRVLKSRHLTQSTLEAYDKHFKGCMQGFPAYQQIRNNHYVDPTDLPPIMYLQNARLMLHRHNLAPTSTAPDRSAALDHCASVAADTASLLRRSMQERSPGSRPRGSEGDDTWQKRLVSAASAFLCTHIWRCALFLSFRSDFENAIWCTQASAALGASRPVNIACGRYLQFFVEEMISKTKQGMQLDTDETMIAYASGDLQGSFENSWIWRETEGEIYVGKSLRNSMAVDEQTSGAISPTDSAPWNGWDVVLGLLDNLFHEKQRRQEHQAIVESSIRPPLTLPPLIPSPNLTNPSNRMSIKDLI